jgi:ER membrane protein complex subunit 8/9
MAEPELEMSTRAYGKLIMHAAKYPSCAISGLLLAKRDDLRPGGAAARVIKYTDCIPLFHLGTGLTPMVEVALTQVRGH